MNGIYTDYLTGHKVLFSSSRGSRPQFYKAGRVSVTEGIRCPFCPENSDLLDSLVYNKNGIKIVPNKYPALDSESGFHDVVIDTLNHNERFVEFSVNSVKLVLTAIQCRVQELWDYSHIQYIQVFKNDGINSGASITHSHWQMAALNFIPEKPERIHANIDKFWQENKIAYFDYIYNLKENIVFENNLVFAYCPIASPFSHYTRIALKGSAMFRELHDKDLLLLAEGLSTVTKALNNVFANISGCLSYNICFHLSPRGSRSPFFLEIIPRHGQLAGFELSTGCFINHTSPREAAENIKMWT